MGLDIGGTSTRALVVDLDGNRVSQGHGGGANITSYGPDRAVAAVAGAVCEAVAGVNDPATIRYAVIGSAGDANWQVPEVAAGFARMWASAGLSCSYRIVSDVDVAFASGTADPNGTLVLSGTGAIAIRYRERSNVHAADGHGWLLGDLGSGFWLGREAVRATLAALDRLDAPGALGLAVLGAVLGDHAGGHEAWLPGDLPRGPAGLRDVATDLVLSVHRRPPVTLSELAPLVTGTVDDDPEAQRIVTEAAGHLVAAATTVRGAIGDGQPMVLAGSLLASPTPVRQLVEPQLRALWPESEVLVARNAAAGAAWLAAGHLIGLDTAGARALHAVLCAVDD